MRQLQKHRRQQMDQTEEQKSEVQAEESQVEEPQQQEQTSEEQQSVDENVEGEQDVQEQEAPRAGNDRTGSPTRRKQHELCLRGKSISADTGDTANCCILGNRRRVHRADGTFMYEKMMIPGKTGVSVDRKEICICLKSITKMSIRVEPMKLFPSV